MIGTRNNIQYMLVDSVSNTESMEARGPQKISRFEQIVSRFMKNISTVSSAQLDLFDFSSFREDNDKRMIKLSLVQVRQSKIAYLLLEHG